MTVSAMRPEPAPHAARARMERLTRRFALSREVPGRFFAANAAQIAETCLAMARRFEQGGRLFVFGEGAQASDAAHVAVEFVHPVLVGKRALPAIALPGEAVLLLPRLQQMAAPPDIAMAITVDGESGGALAGLAHARATGLLTIGLAGGTGGTMRGDGLADWIFVVEAQDPLVIQETHETLYHVLWELVHLFFDQRVAR